MRSYVAVAERGWSIGRFADGANGDESCGVFANRRLDGRLPLTGRRFHDNGGRRANDVWAAPPRRTIGVSRLRAFAGETRAHVVVLGMQGGLE